MLSIPRSEITGDSKLGLAVHIVKSITISIVLLGCLLIRPILADEDSLGLTATPSTQQAIYRALQAFGGQKAYLGWMTEPQAYALYPESNTFSSGWQLVIAVPEALGEKAPMATTQYFRTRLEHEYGLRKIQAYILVYTTKGFLHLQVRDTDGHLRSYQSSTSQDIPNGPLGFGDFTPE